eukprot:m.145242 g.145242  ORF g.145242 m.145242 type:complete len:67 (+) comp13229_c0_seq1:34-234(+)
MKKYVLVYMCDKKCLWCYYQIINESPFLTADVLEEFMPYSLIRCAHHALLKDAKQSVLEGEEPIVA